MDSVQEIAKGWERDLRSVFESSDAACISTRGDSCHSFRCLRFCYSPRTSLSHFITLIRMMTLRIPINAFTEGFDVSCFF